MCSSSDFFKIFIIFTKLSLTNSNSIFHLFLDDAKPKDTVERFEFHHGEPLIIKKSVFQAHLLHIDDESKIPLARKQLFDEHKRVQDATHNIMAYRLIKTIDNRKIEHSNYDDDGETQVREIDRFFKDC